MTADLAAVAAFTEARLVELEAVAKAAAKATPPPWEATGEDIVSAADDPHWRGACAANASGAEAAHIALNDPAHGLRVVAFGRTLLALHEHLANPKGIMNRVSFPVLARLTGCIILDFAQIWEKHPEFKENWKPR